MKQSNSGTDLVATVRALIRNSRSSGPLAQGIALALGVASVPMAYAQTAAAVSEPIEEVVVTGIRASLTSSAKLKRDTQGVVDGIFAEDIGKFPDTNLAEAIQRVPGVTIDRVNNEGSRVTVRGFGPEFNLVTLNGRSMPGGVSAGQGSTRSFDFANLSADGVAGIAVYKTGRADVASGGIGSTINITTARPFDHQGRRGAFQAKAIDDTSTEVGSKITPEVSGMFSDTFLDGKLGFLVNGSYSKRNSRLEEATIGGWLHDQISPTSARLSGTNLNPGGHNWEPQSQGYGFNDYQRTRTNGQVVLQFKPVESLVATVDYTYSLYKNSQQRHSFGSWYGAWENTGDLISAKVNEHGTVVDAVALGNDLSYFSGDDKYENKGGSTGLNLKWEALDNLTLTLDAHHSSMDSGGAPTGNNNFFIVGQQPLGSLNKVFHVGNLQIPTVTWNWSATDTPYDAGAPYIGVVPGGRTVNNVDTSTISPLFAQANFNGFETKIDEVRFHTEWKNKNGDSGLRSMEFGLESKTMKTRATSSGSFFPTGYYFPGNDGLIPASAFTKVPSSSILRSFSGGGSGIAVPYFFTYSVADAVAATKGGVGFYGGFANPCCAAAYTFAVPSAPTVDNRIRESTPAAFVQLNFDTDFNGMRFRAMPGLRYERTTVTANSLQLIPTAVNWANPTEFFTLYGTSTGFTDVGSRYSKFLPSLDTSLQVRPDVIVRASYSKTITRSDLSSMVGIQTVSDRPKPGARTAQSGNPALRPYESNNFDFSAEWYYAKDSYLAVNWFKKDVTDFLTTTTTQSPLFGLTDPRVGAVATAARNQLIAAGNPNPSDQEIFAVTGAITGKPGDPLIVWDITAPSNANQTEIHGWEFAAQHVFGDTGFGLQANVSLPTGGAKFNNEIVGVQFALPGLSKSYNLVAFYEKHGFQTRLAYTHRSSFLSATSQDQAANEPQNVEAYSQLDASASYEFNDKVGVFVDAINLTSQSQRVYGRYSEQFLYAFEGKARYQLGVHVKF